MKMYSILLILLLSQMLNTQAQTYHPLSGGNFTEDWTNIGLITVNDDWSAFASIKGFLGDDGTTTANPRDPQLQLVDYLTMDVIANITNPNTNSSGGVGACAITNPVVALQGSGTADNPFLMIYLNTTGVTGIQIQYNLRDVDSSADNSIQPVAFQYRVGSAGNFTNLASAFVADASSGPSLATLETPISLTLPVECENQSQVQIRIMTGNAVGSDEWIGIDDIIVSGTTSSTNTVTFTITDSTSAPIVGATITINGQTLTTDTFGIASINLPDASYPYTITASGFNDTTGNAVVAGTALAVNVTMTTTPTYTANHLQFVNVPATGNTAVNLASFTVEALRADNSIDSAFTNNITLAVVSGTGNISGTTTIAAVAGIAIFNDIQFDAADTYTISASSGTLTIATSGNIVISDPVVTAILPTSYDWTPSTNYPQGWTNNGLTFYTTGNLAPNSGKFDNQDDNFIVFYDTSACIVEYYLKGNSLSVPYQLDLMESVDGNTYSVLITHSDTQNSLTSAYQYFSVSPVVASRYIKFNYTVKTAGNIAIDDVLIDLCTGINIISNNKSDITLYPNPAKQVLYVSNFNQNSTISIMNILGETVYSSTNLKLNNLSIPLEKILTGFYILISVDANGNKNSIRFIKE